MITAIIETWNNEIDLAHLLAALVPAATEGVVREVVVIDHGSSDGTLTVADVAGCTVIEAQKEARDPRHRAATEARGDWLLFLSPLASLTPGWHGSALAFIDRALVTGQAQSRVATFRRGAMSTGWKSWLRSLVFGREGLLVAKTAYLAANAPSQPSLASRVSGVHRGAA